MPLFLLFLAFLSVFQSAFPLSRAQPDSGVLSGEATSSQCLEKFFECENVSQVCIDEICKPRLRLNQGPCETSQQCPDSASCRSSGSGGRFVCSCNEGLKQLDGACRELNFCLSHNDCRSGQRCTTSHCEFGKDYDKDTQSYAWIWYMSMVVGGFIICYVGIRVFRDRQSDSSAVETDIEQMHSSMDQRDRSALEGSHSRSRPLPSAPESRHNTCTIDGPGQATGMLLSMTGSRSQTVYQPIATVDTPPPFEPPPPYEEVDQSAKFVRLP